MKYPIMLITGTAGAGKDSLAEALVKALKTEAVTLGHADLMKRFCDKVFQFHPSQLWGESDQRDAPDPRFKDGGTLEIWGEIRERFMRETSYFLAELAPYVSVEAHSIRTNFEQNWFNKLENFNFEQGFLSPRIILQTFGTEFGRSLLGKDVWSDYAVDIAKKCLNFGYNYRREVGLTSETLNPKVAIITDGRFRNEVLNINKINGINICIYGDRKGVNAHSSEKEIELMPPHWFDYMVYNPKNSLSELEDKAAEIAYQINRAKFL